MLKKERESKKLSKDIQKWLVPVVMNSYNVILAPTKPGPSIVYSNKLKILKIESE